jgi:cellulose synthase/poly-beta-1,6-N-acetylglucosamine synthase-like glycosyltransferase
LPQTTILGCELLPLSHPHPQNHVDGSESRPPRRPSLVTMRQMKEFTYSQMKIMVATLLYFFMFKLAGESKEATYKILTSFFFLLSLLTFFCLCLIIHLIQNIYSNM